MRILVTGGAGYVGSVTVERLVADGHAVTVLDNLRTGHREAVDPGAELIVGSFGDRGLVAATLKDHHIDAVLHCAARSLVGESVEHPELYYQENVVGGLALLEATGDARVDRLVLSSTAAVYGEPERVPIEESDRTEPMNPYGATKLAFEGMMRAFAVHGLRSIALRYFNVGGASDRFGEAHDPETHLIPNLLRAIESGTPATLFGTDYATPDGTPIRDYIHVMDLADAHVAALERTATMAPGFEAINLGSGSGFSVNEVVAAAGRVLGREIPVVVGPRRSGDPASLVASNQRAAEHLGWHPTRGSLDEMVGSTWRWMNGHARSPRSSAESQG
jgi:UDP-glucose 4-epimerase